MYRTAVVIAGLACQQWLTKASLEQWEGHKAAERQIRSKAGSSQYSTEMHLPDPVIISKFSTNQLNALANLFIAFTPSAAFFPAQLALGDPCNIRHEALMAPLRCQEGPSLHERAGREGFRMAAPAPAQAGPIASKAALDAIEKVSGKRPGKGKSKGLPVKIAARTSSDEQASGTEYGRKQGKASDEQASGTEYGRGQGKVKSPIMNRFLALDAIKDVQHGKDLEDALDTEYFNKIHSKRKNFVRSLAGTTMRRVTQIDKVLEDAIKVPSTPKSRDILRLGATQLLVLDVPEYAAVSTTLELAEHAGMGKYKGLFSKALKRIAENFTRYQAELSDTSTALPRWFKNKLLNASNGLSQTDIGAIGAALLREKHPLDLTLRDTAEANIGSELIDAVDGARLIGKSTVRLPADFRGSLSELPGFDSGEWWVQDVSAAFSVLAMNNAMPLQGKRVADLCAAPGGKTMQLAALGATVTAVDQSQNRIKRLKENLERTNLNVERIICADAHKWAMDAPRGVAESFDGVLIDAPCTATGVLRRHPGVIIKQKKKPEMRRILHMQEDILNGAARMVKVGGILVYSTCSLLRTEGEDQISSFLTAEGGERFERVPIKQSEMPDELVDAINEDGDLRFYPHMLEAQGGVDGFFVSRMRRIA